jgi:hypothetical protein
MSQKEKKNKRKETKEEEKKRRVGARATCVVPAEEKTGVVVYRSGELQ